MSEQHTPRESSTIQRSLGRIEGKQETILQELRRQEEKLGDHMNADQVTFSAIRVMIQDKFDEQKKSRDLRLDDQDRQIAEIVRYVNWARGASWPILGLLGLIGLVGVGILVTIVTAWMNLRR